MGNNKGLDLIGQVFTRLTVKEDTGERNPKKGKIWLCLCSCGEYKEVSTVHLRDGNVKSCGCLFQEINNSKTKKSSIDKSSCKKSTRIPKEEIITSIPSELKNIPYAFVENELFLVFKNARIFRCTKKISECTITDTNGYKSVSANVNGRQKFFYVHRLLAKAFIPNLENKPIAVFKDGDYSNLSLDNIMWATNADRAKKSNEAKKRIFLENAKPCKKCGNLKLEEEVCLKCRDELKKQENKKLVIQQRIERVSDINLDVLTTKQRRIVELVSEGRTYQEVGDILGVTRQNVQSTLKLAKERSNNPKKQHPNNRKMRKGTDAKDFTELPVIRRLRKINNLTLKDAAELLDIPVSTYRLKELNPKTFTVGEIVQLSYLYNEKVEVLIDLIK